MVSAAQTEAPLRLGAIWFLVYVVLQHAKRICFAL